MLHRRCRSSTSDSLSSSCSFCARFCMWSFCSLAGKIPLPKSWQQVMIDRHQMVHKKECLKHISWPSINKYPSSRPFFSFISLIGTSICLLLDLVLCLGPIQCITLSGPHTILYLRLVLLMNFRITLLQWDKAKKTLTQDEENGNFDSPTEHALNTLGFPSQFECSEWKLAKSIGLPIINLLIMHKKQLGWRQTFPTKWAGTNLEMLSKGCVC